MCKLIRNIGYIYIYIYIPIAFGQPRHRAWPNPVKTVPGTLPKYQAPKTMKYRAERSAIFRKGIWCKNSRQKDGQNDANGALFDDFWHHFGDFWHHSGALGASLDLLGPALGPWWRKVPLLSLTPPRSGLHLGPLFDTFRSLDDFLMDFWREPFWGGSREPFWWHFR